MFSGAVTDRDPFERPRSRYEQYRAKGNRMRNLVQPPPSQHCDLCHGELRLKQLRQTGHPLNWMLRYLSAQSADMSSRIG